MAGARAMAAGEGGGGEAGHPIVSRSATLLAQMTGRRQKLPVPKTETEGINLWNLGRTRTALETFLRPQAGDKLCDSVPWLPLAVRESSRNLAPVIFLMSLENLGNCIK